MHSVTDDHESGADARGAERGDKHPTTGQRSKARRGRPRCNPQDEQPRRRRSPDRRHRALAAGDRAPSLRPRRRAPSAANRATAQTESVTTESIQASIDELVSRRGNPLPTTDRKTIGSRPNSASRRTSDRFGSSDTSQATTDASARPSDMTDRAPTTHRPASVFALAVSCAQSSSVSSRSRRVARRAAGRG